MHFPPTPHYSDMSRHIRKGGRGNYRSNNQVLFCYLTYAFLLLGGAEATDNHSSHVGGVQYVAFSFDINVFQADLAHVISKTHKGVP